MKGTTQRFWVRAAVYAVNDIAVLAAFFHAFTLQSKYSGFPPPHMEVTAVFVGIPTSLIVHALARAGIDPTPFFTQIPVGLAYVLNGLAVGLLIAGVARGIEGWRHRTRQIQDIVA